MATSLHLQNPGGAPTLSSELLRVAASATSGGGIFAWTTVGGVSDVLETPTFKAFLSAHAFDLIVGTDTITNPAALSRLEALQVAHPKLKVRAFWHDQAALFHPKLAWFELPGGLTLIVGSGNLTSGGLSRNWEFFIASELGAAETAQVKKQLKTWRSAHAAHLLPLNEQRVLDRIAKNRLEERTILRSRRAVEAVAGARVSAATGTVEVLVAEPTYASGRPTQANFNKHHFERFFRARAGVSSLHDFFPVSTSAAVGARQPLAAVTDTRSGNYRFELRAPGSSPWSPPYPIGVFMRLETDEILYHLLAPGDPGYQELESLLQARAGRTASNRRRQEVITVDELRAAWPSSYLLKAEPPPP